MVIFPAPTYVDRLRSLRVGSARVIAMRPSAFVRICLGVQMPATGASGSIFTAAARS